MAHAQIAVSFFALGRPMFLPLQAEARRRQRLQQRSAVAALLEKLRRSLARESNGRLLLVASSWFLLFRGASAEQQDRAEAQQGEANQPPSGRGLATIFFTARFSAPIASEVIRCIAIVARKKHKHLQHSFGYPAGRG
jgi:hypothetical protein